MLALWFSLSLNCPLAKLTAKIWSRLLCLQEDQLEDTKQMQVRFMYSLKAVIMYREESKIILIFFIVFNQGGKAHNVEVEAELSQSGFETNMVFIRVS